MVIHVLNFDDNSKYTITQKVIEHDKIIHSEKVEEGYAKNKFAFERNLDRKYLNLVLD